MYKKWVHSIVCLVLALQVMGDSLLFNDCLCFPLIHLVLCSYIDCVIWSHWYIFISRLIDQYHSLANMYPWVVYLVTNHDPPIWHHWASFSLTVVSWKSAHGRSTLQVCQWGRWVLFRLFPHFTMKERPRHVYSDLKPSKQIIGHKIMYNVITSGFEVESWWHTTLWTVQCDGKHTVACG